LRPAPGGFLELVGPAPVISQRGAAEELRVVGGGLVREEDNDLPLHIDALVIIPIELRRGDAVSEEDGLGVELLALRLRLAPAGEALFAGDVERGFPFYRPKRRFRAGDDAQE